MIPNAGPRAWPERWFFTDDVRTPQPDKIIRRLRAGSGAVFRHYAAPARARLARRAARLCRDRSLPLLIAADPALAARLGAFGVHWPEAALQGPVRAPAPPGLAVTAAVHCETALTRAEAAGAEAVFASPVFATPSHPERAPMGLKGLARLCARARVPVYAVGGITAENAQSALDAGAAGTGGISLFL